jgi:hypothetical protein
MNVTVPSGNIVLAELGIDTNKIRFIESRYKQTQYRAAINWLTKYNPRNNTSNIEKVKGFIESFYHLCEIQEWKIVNKIFLFSIDKTTANQLVHQLDIWGYYPEGVTSTPVTLSQTGFYRIR